MIERYEIVNKYDDTPVGAESISALQLEQSNNMTLKPNDTSSKQRADMESAPTEKYHRRSIRLPHYDYSRAGYYFVTITAQNREHLFGEIYDGEMVLNVAGEMVQGLWCDITNDFPNVALHDFVVMPNHIHGIIQIKYRDTVGADSISALQSEQPNNVRSKSNDMPSKQRADMESAPTVSTIVQSFKRHTTLQYIKMVKNNTLPPFNKRIWQRNYYEHVVRDNNDYARIVQYIENNPSTWNDDMLNT